MFLTVKFSATLVAIGTCVSAILVWYLRKHKGSDFSRSAVRLHLTRGAQPVEKRDLKLGLTFRYNPVECVFKGEIRSFPVAVFEFRIVYDESARILVTVEECAPDISLEEYKVCAIRDVMTQLPGVQVVREKPSTMCGNPAVEFEYTHMTPQGSQKRVWYSVTMVNKRAYGVQYTSDEGVFKWVRLAQEIGKSISITASKPGDSFLFFTEPRYGLGLKVPVTHHVDPSQMQEKGVIARFMALHDTSRGGDMLDKSFIELRVVHDFDVRPTYEGTLESALTVLKRMIELGVGEGETLQWKASVSHDNASSFLRRVDPNQFTPHNIILKRTNLPGKYIYYDICCQSADGASDIVIRYVAMICVWSTDAFVLTSWCEEEHFPEVSAQSRECFHSLCFGNQYGQEDSVMYCNPAYRFSVRVPAQFQLHEPPIGDPLVLMTPSQNTTIEDITTTWVAVDATDTDSTPTMSSVPVVVDSADDFTVHIRVQDVITAISLKEFVTEYVADLRQTPRLEIEEERSSALDGIAAREIIYTQNRDDGTLLKCWSVLVVNGGRQYALQLATTAEHFRQWKKVFRGMLSSFRFHTVDVR
eukprot:PhF_6_TR19006/c0_g1_i1/m.27860